MTKPVCDGMTDRGWGRVINISSINGQKGAFGQTNYINIFVFIWQSRYSRSQNYRIANMLCFKEDRCFCF
jgi:NADP-dependent 3-hydroxy acid dehydrogenase YdfG